jgi:hypothetical protein
MELNIPTKADFEKLACKLDQILSLLEEEENQSVNDWVKSKEAKTLLKCSDSTLKNCRIGSGGKRGWS